MEAQRRNGRQVVTAPLQLLMASGQLQFRNTQAAMALHRMPVSLPSLGR